MRDAFGGVFMMRLMLVFVVIFVAFSAVSLNYAKAFKIKNQVTDVIEQMEIQRIEDISTYHKRIEAIAENANYDTSHCKNGPITDEKGKTIGDCHSGIKIIINNEHNNDNYIYYNVITYGGWNLSSLNMLLVLGGKAKDSADPMFGSWAITGEAKVRNYSKTGKTEIVKTTEPEAPYSDIINGDRCDKKNKTWVRVSTCQSRDVNGGKCNLVNIDGSSNGTILRNHLDEGYNCKELTNEYNDSSQNGYKCYNKEKEQKWVYVTGCQAGNVIGAHCKYKNGEKTIIRTYLTDGYGCTTPKPKNP